MTRAGGGGRRSGRGHGSRLNLTAILAVLVPLVTVGLLALTAVGVPTPPPMTPDLQELDRADLGCPSAVSGSTVLVGSAAEPGSGSVELRSLGEADAEPVPLAVTPGAVSSADAGADPVVVTGLDALAPGLLATRTGGKVLAATRCPAPQPETWFAGLGARAGHSSVIELVNPDVGAAVVDVEVFSPRGALDVPDVRGIRVPGRTTVRIDLAETVPRRGDVAVRVAVSRGRAAVTVLDSVGDFGSEEALRDWIPGQPAPATTLELLGLPTGPGSRTLSVLNPGDSEARVTVQVIAPESVFAPTGVDELQLGPGATGTIRLDRVLAAETRKGATGLVVTATEPVVASVASNVDGDLAIAGQVGVVTDEAAVVLPEGTAQLLLAGASTSGAATVVSADAGGEQLGVERVELGRDRSQAVDLPRGTASVVVTLERTSVVAAVLVTGGPGGPGAGGAGAVVLPLVEVERFGYVPDVQPALP